MYMCDMCLKVFVHRREYQMKIHLQKEMLHLNVFSDTIIHICLSFCVNRFICEHVYTHINTVHIYFIH